MSRSISRLFLFGAILFVLISLTAYLIGKYRTSFFTFDLSFCSFALFVILSSVYVLGGKRIPLLGWIPLFILFLVTVWLLSSHFIQTLQAKEDKNYQEWVLTKVKAKGEVLELPHGIQVSKELSAYQDLNLQEHLQEIKKGYLLEEIFPRFNRLTRGYFAQLQFMGVKYVVVHLGKRKKKTHLAVDGIPVARAFKRELIFKIPIRKRLMTVLYSRDFTDKPISSFPEQTKWMTESLGKLYLHNHGSKQLNINIKALFVARFPTQIRVTHENSNKIVWEGLVTGKTKSLLFENLNLLPGKNPFLIEVLVDNQVEAPISSLLSAQHDLGFGIVKWERSQTVISPQKVASLYNKSFPQNKDYQKWLKSLPHDETLLEYPLVYLKGENPIAYELISKEQQRRNINFKYDKYKVEFPTIHFENEPTLTLPFWADYLGIDYIVIHTALYEWPPIVKPDSGLIEVARFGEAIIYRPQTERLILESEKTRYGVGARVFDSGAKGGMSRLVNKRISNGRPVFMVHGPYAPLEPGRYQVTYRLKTETKRDQEIAIIDVTSDLGKHILAQKKLKASQFSQPKEWEDFVLQFELKETRLIEFRVKYLGEDISLWADYILIEKQNQIGDS